MKGMVQYAALLLAAGFVGAAWPAAARAQVQGAVPRSTSPTSVPPRETRAVEQSRPNAGLISSGVFTFGVPYVTSVVIASQSDHPGDNKLYVPVAGPWLNLANRGPCGGRGMPSCDNENMYKVLLVANGVLQGLGALEILGGLMFPETRTAPVAAERPRPVKAEVFSPTIHVAPAMLGHSAYGFSAVGTF